jgi:hypothetical protein
MCTGVYVCVCACVCVCRFIKVSFELSPYKLRIITVLCDFQSDCVSEFVRKRLRVHSLHLQVEGLCLKSRRARGGVLLLR